MTVAQLQDPGAYGGLAAVGQLCLGVLGVEEAGAVEVVAVRVDAEEGGGENDEALVVLGTGERVRVVSAQSPRPEASRSTLVFDLQIFPVNRTGPSVSGLDQRRDSPVSSSGTRERL